jgi:hypothetical protein
MKNYLFIAILLFSTCSFSQDFKFKGKTTSIIKQDFNRGDDTPVNEEEIKKKEAVSFDGVTLLIGKESYKYMWHQSAKEGDIMQLNCIERVETANYPYIDAKFELDFQPDDVIKITQYRETSPTTFSKTNYTIKIIKTTN